MLSLLFLLRSGTVKKGVSLKSREIALQSPHDGRKPRRLFAVGEYHRNTEVLVISYDTVFNLPAPRPDGCHVRRNDNGGNVPLFLFLSHGGKRKFVRAIFCEKRGS